MARPRLPTYRAPKTAFIGGKTTYEGQLNRFIGGLDYLWGSIANKNGWQIELTEQMTDVTAKTCHSKDNVPVTVDV